MQKADNESRERSHGGLCLRRVKATNALDTSRSVTPAILSAAGAVEGAGGAQRQPRTSWPRPSVAARPARRGAGYGASPAGTRVDSPARAACSRPTRPRPPAWCGTPRPRPRFGSTLARRTSGPSLGTLMPRPASPSHGRIGLQIDQAPATPGHAARVLAPLRAAPPHDLASPSCSHSHSVIDVIGSVARFRSLSSV